MATRSHFKNFQAMILMGTVALGSMAVVTQSAHADPGAITNLHVTSNNDVVWDPTPDAYWYDVTEYTSSGVQSHMVAGSGNTYHDSYLDGYAHEFSVAAVFGPPGAPEAAGPESWTSEAPQNVSFRGYSLTWSPVAGPFGYPVTYNIYRNGTLVSSTQGINLSGQLYYKPTSLSSGDTFTVAVADPGGSGNSISLPGTSLYLAAPSGVQLYNECGRGYELDWNPVPGATSYNVYADGVLLATGITDTRYGFGATSAHSYQVTAVSHSTSPWAESAPSSPTSNPEMDYGACD